MENRLSQEKAEALSALRGAFCFPIDDLAWKNIMQEKGEICAFYLAKMKEKRKTYMRNKKLAPLWMRYVSEALLLNGLEPTAIDFELHSKNDGENVFARSGFVINSFKIFLSDDGNSKALLFQNDADPINRALDSVALHEVTHLVKNHAIESLSIVFAACKYLNKDFSAVREKIEKTSEYLRLVLAQEKEADIFHPVRHWKAADGTMIADKLFRTRPDIWGVPLYKGSYALAKMADTNWKILRALELSGAR